MSILITGGTGFVGAHLTRLMVDAKDEHVVVFDRYPNRERVADILDNFTLVEGDVLEPQDLMAAMSGYGVDRVIHLAAIPGAARPDRGLQYVRSECIGTANVFEAARLSGVTRVVNASSAGVFGQNLASDRPPATEEDATRPSDLYGACELWSEQLGEFYNQRHPMQVLSLRLCASLGFGRLNRASLKAGLTTERRIYMAAPEIIALGEAVTVPPDDEVADFLYVVDAAEAFWLAATVPRPEHSVFNVRAEQRSVGDYTRALRDLMPEGQIAVSTTPARIVQLLDNSRLVEELGFTPRYTLEQGLAEYVEHVHARLNSGA